MRLAIVRQRRDRRRARNMDRARSASGGTWSPHRPSGAGPTARWTSCVGARLQQLHLLDRSVELGALLRQPRALGRDRGVLRGASCAGAGPSPFSRASRSASRGSRSASLSRSSSRSGEIRCDRSVSARTPSPPRRAGVSIWSSAARIGSMPTSGACCAARAATRRAQARIASSGQARAPRSRIGTWRPPLQVRALFRLRDPAGVKQANFACSARRLLV